MIENPYVGRRRRDSLLLGPVSVRRDEVVYELHREIELHVGGLVPGCAEGNISEVMALFVPYSSDIGTKSLDGQQDCVST